MPKMEFKVLSPKLWLLCLIGIPIPLAYCNTTCRADTAQTPLSRNLMFCLCDVQADTFETNTLGLKIKGRADGFLFFFSSKSLENLFLPSLKIFLKNSIKTLGSFFLPHLPTPDHQLLLLCHRKRDFLLLRLLLYGCVILIFNKLLHLGLPCSFFFLFCLSCFLRNSL